MDAVRKKGIERGLISEDVQLTKRDMFNLIFEYTDKIIDIVKPK